MLVREYSVKNRIYVEYLPEDPRADLDKYLSSHQKKYLEKVIRYTDNDLLEIFNSHTSFICKRIQGKFTTVEYKKINTIHNNKILYFSPLRSHLNDLIVEKCAEIGIEYLQPVIFFNSSTKYINIERLKRISIEATEQSLQYMPCVIKEPIYFKELINKINDKKIITCHKDNNVSSIFKLKDYEGIIIGPEGGFSSLELDLLKKNTYIASLGDSMLRAETAAIIASYFLLNSK